MMPLSVGGGSGIGRAVCRVLAREGARVVAADVNSDAAQQTVDLLISKYFSIGYLIEIWLYLIS